MPDTTDAPDQPAVTAEGFRALLEAEMAFKPWWGFEIGALAPGACRLIQPVRPEFHRPGGIVGGPILFGLVDACMYGVVLSLVGREAGRMATTTDISIRFLRPASGTQLFADGRVIKAGKRLVVCEVEVHPEGSGDAVVHAVGTYSVPPSGAPIPA